MAKIILISFVITFGLRAVPYLFFGRASQVPHWLEYLGRYLPPAIMASLVIYATKDFWQSGEPRLAMLLGLVATIGMHLYRKNTILSIIVGTAVYMFMLRL